MAKKRKKKKSKGYDPAYWSKKYLENLKEGKYVGQTQRRYPTPIGTLKISKSRHRKFYVPKWIWKVKDKWLQSDYITYHEKHWKFPNNEERILARLEGNLRFTVREIAKETVIDYKNISRYLKKMERKGLITLEPDYRFKHTKSGRLKQYHTKRARLTEKGRIVYKSLFGRNT